MKKIRFRIPVAEVEYPGEFYFITFWFVVFLLTFFVTIFSEHDYFWTMLSSTAGMIIGFVSVVNGSRDLRIPGLIALGVSSLSFIHAYIEIIRMGGRPLVVF